MGVQIAINFDAPESRETRLDREFREFHERHPHVYATLARLARQAVARGRTRIGAKALWERMRWELSIETDAGDFKLNNNLVSRYARELMRCEPDLAGVFETRELRS